MVALYLGARKQGLLLGLGETFARALGFLQELLVDGHGCSGRASSTGRRIGLAVLDTFRNLAGWPRGRARFAREKGARSSGPGGGRGEGAADLGGERATAPVRPVGRIASVSRGSASVRLVRGDNLSALVALVAELQSQVMLAYLDPPFFTGGCTRSSPAGRDEAGKVLRATRPPSTTAGPTFRATSQAFATAFRASRALRARGVRRRPRRPANEPLRQSPVRRNLRRRCFRQRDRLALPALAEQDAELPARARRSAGYVKDPATKPRFVQLFEPLAPSTPRPGDWKAARGRRRTADRTRSSTTRGAFARSAARRRLGHRHHRAGGQRANRLPDAEARSAARALDPRMHPSGRPVLDPYAGSATTLASRHGSGGAPSESTRARSPSRWAKTPAPGLLRRARAARRARARSFWPP